MEPPAQSPALLPFGSYLLDELIAVGGMARVYRARLRGLGGFEKTLVVKQILPELATDPRFVSMFVEEAKTLVQLSHPHIVPIYELGVIDGVYFLSMEYVDGATLADLLADGPLPPELAAHVGMQLAEALHFAHARFELVHRDVTPRNVLVDGEGHVRLVDFGIAAPTDDAGEAGVFGSPGYMSPEQARGEAVGVSSDLFSLGAVLYQALTGEAAFLRDDPGATRAALLEAPPPRLAGREDVPPALAATVDACLAPAPEDRPGSAAEVARALRAWLSTEHPEGVAPALGARTTRARARAARRGAEVTPTPTRASDPGGGTRSLATSPVLTALLEGGEEERAPVVAAAGPAGEPRTVPITGRVEASARPEEAPPSNLARARAALALLAIAAAVAAGALLLRPDPADRGGGAPSGTAGEAPAKAAARPVGEVVALEPTAPARTLDEPTPAPEAPAPAEDPAPAAPATRASLEINATPWAAVTVDGRPVGNTPVRRVAVAPGAHLVRFECPPLGRATEITVRTEAGQTRRVLARLDADPPTASAR